MIGTAKVVAILATAIGILMGAAAGLAFGLHRADTSVLLEEYRRAQVIDQALARLERPAARRHAELASLARGLLAGRLTLPDATGRLGRFLEAEWDARQWERFRGLPDGATDRERLGRMLLAAATAEVASAARPNPQARWAARLAELERQLSALREERGDNARWRPRPETHREARG
jgi:hypothetical protein